MSDYMRREHAREAREDALEIERLGIARNTPSYRTRFGAAFGREWCARMIAIKDADRQYAYRAMVRAANAASRMRAACGGHPSGPFDLERILASLCQKVRY